MAAARGHTHMVQQFQRPRLGFGLRHAICQLRDNNVFKRCKFGQKVMKLIDKSNIAASRFGAGAVGQPNHIAARQRDRALIRRIQQPRDVQQR